MSTEILPDSRLQRIVGAIPGPGGWWQPVFCAVCGKPFGYVPEENCDFACWLCNECSEIHGAVFNGMMMPDEVFWEEVKQAQLDKIRRDLGDMTLTERQIVAMIAEANK